MVNYLLLGETSIGRKRVERMRRVIAQLPDIEKVPGIDHARGYAEVPDHYVHLFQAGKTVIAYDPVGGNHARLMENSNSGIESIVADIDDARDHVHLLFYIWLSDNNGLKVAEALIRAAARGVCCRAMIERQESYIAHSRPVKQKMVANWGWQKRLWNNTIAMLGPVL